MNIIIMGGFLGSGKTSLIIQLAKHLVSKETKHESDVKVAIVENEIGATGIDDKLIRNEGFSVENLFAGCACCSLNGELITSVDKIKKDLNPKWLIIEATGVAYPAGIKKTLNTYLQLDSFILTIVDAKRWKRLIAAMEMLVIGQLEDSSLVLLNKVDLVNAEELEQAKQSISHFNDKVEICSISAKEELPIELFEYIEKKVEENSNGN